MSPTPSEKLAIKGREEISGNWRRSEARGVLVVAVLLLFITEVSPIFRLLGSIWLTGKQCEREQGRIAQTMSR